MSFADGIKNATELRQQFLAEGLIFGEGPRFHNGKLYLSDMLGKKIYTVDESGKKEILVEVEQQPNGLGFMKDGSLVYTSMVDTRLYRYNNGKSELFADLGPFMTGLCGDMVIDSFDRVYVDDTGRRLGAPAGIGHIIMVDSDGTIKTAAEGLHFPNGLAIDGSGKTLYAVSSLSKCLNAFEIADSGELINRREVWNLSNFSDGTGMNTIDGICIDGEDAIWLSLLDHQVFARRDTKGTITDIVKVDGHATACALGGKDGRTLYLVTNKLPEPNEGGHAALGRAMLNRSTKCTISTVRVKVPRGNGLP